ncbi:hypothetical protein [Wenzhouxiangella sediminis]|uniref:Uncharacterized protein n=1 Tax=Wenzhouxiangella sediminis TaxID=1792836 RepID=A0A3E1KAS3_9GAMM|nr:hypothetical protein [Wenzhouxiangella sediminis]RFF31544.1 hypothetical protein DZC52_04075 [Wenzhouxiangella sediminis]
MTAATVLSVGIATGALAHNPLDHPDWCTENARLVVVDEFEWDGEMLAQEVREASKGSDDTCSSPQSGDTGMKTCGQFDDDWGAVNAMAIHHCDGYAVRFVDATHPDHGTVIHIAEGPEAFNDEEGHHDRYRARMGLRAMCVRCEPVVLEPLRPGKPVDPVR